MKGDLTLKLLEALKDGALDGESYLRAFLTCGYGASFRQIQSKAFKANDFLSRKSINSKLSKEEFKIMNNRFYAMLSKLEQDGLVEKTKMDENSIIRITKKGISKIDVLKERKLKELPSKKYKSKSSNKISIVIFDIPETEKRKRDWLRVVLVGLGFNMIQKSVWMGKVKIPVDFLKELRELNIINFIEIFEITKTGSLRQLK